MKYTKLCVFFILVLLFYSCPGGVPHYHQYEKAFFLGEDLFLMNGTVFENYNYGTENEIPKEFNTISVRAENVDGWEIKSATKGNGKFECLITITANGVTISKETIQNSDSGIIPIDFYLDDEDIYSCMAYYKEKDRYTDGYNVNSNRYVYVMEAKDLSETYTREYNGPPWDHITTYHNDLNFSKSGWYKIIYSFSPITDDPKHSSGLNTSLNR